MTFPELEDEFTKTCKIMLDVDLKGLDDYGPWLGKRIPLPWPAKSVLSGKEVWMAPGLNFMGKKFAKSKSAD